MYEMGLMHSPIGCYASSLVIVRGFLPGTVTLMAFDANLRLLFRRVISAGRTNQNLGSQPLGEFHATSCYCALFQPSCRL